MATPPHAIRVGRLSTLARVVLNHSTHVQGLIPALHALARGTPAISSIVPGRITTAAAVVDKLSIKVTVATPPSGWKAVARKGRAVQEVFFVTRMDGAQLQTAINAALGTGGRHGSRNSGCSGGDNLTGGAWTNG